MGSVARIPAGDIERLVLDNIKDLLSTPARVIEACGAEKESAAVKEKIIEGARQLGQRLATASAAEQINMISGMIARVVVASDQVIVQTTKQTLRAAINNKKSDASLEASTPDKHPFSISIPARLRRCGGETRLIIPGETNSSQRPNPKLVRALAKAWEWNRQLISGEASSLSDIATRENIARRHVGRRLELAWLAPDITKAILDGEIPADLTISQVLTGLPLDWKQQRKSLGFGSNTI